jgi:hypothetical protein
MNTRLLMTMHVKVGTLLNIGAVPHGRVPRFETTVPKYAPQLSPCSRHRGDPP